MNIVPRRLGIGGGAVAAEFHATISRHPSFLFFMFVHVFSRIFSKTDFTHINIYIYIYEYIIYIYMNIIYIFMISAMCHESSSGFSSQELQAPFRAPNLVRYNAATHMAPMGYSDDSVYKDDVRNM